MSHDFLQLGIRPEVIKYLKAMGITEPTPIQVQAIPELMAGKDLVAQSQTGTGKTLAFLLPILENIKLNTPHVQALIITPTRELALQVTREAKKLADKLEVNVLSVYGGHPLAKQIKQLQGRPHIVIGTPGRILDHVRHKILHLASVSKLVLDEADQMLHRGFLDDMEEIIRQTPGTRQTILLSATIPPKIRNLASRYMKRNTIYINPPVQAVTLSEIEQLIVETTPEEKLDRLCTLIDEYQPYLAIVFCHTKQRVSALTLALAQRKYQVDELHGDLSQAKREQVLRLFRTAKLQILVASDIAARGLDIEGVTHVFNYDIPHDTDSYIHRIGRTGRAGQTGTAVTFVVPGEEIYLRMIEQGIRASLKNQRTKEATILVPSSHEATNRNKRPFTKIRQKDGSPSSPPQKRTTKKAKGHGGINLRSNRKPKSTGKTATQHSRTGKGKASRRTRPS